MRTDGIIVAIDGPAASGKSSTARAVASDLNYRHLDSGAFYRALTRAALDAGLTPDQWGNLAIQQVADLGVSAEPASTGYRLRIRGQTAAESLRSPEVNALVSTMAAIPAVREWLLATLRETGAAGGLVADGRDIGTVVFPDAELKVFLVCHPAERARRRLLEQGVASPGSPELEQEILRLAARDAADSTRSHAPLLQAPDAVLLDTTDLSFAQQVQSILDLARSRIRG
jgi:cytidylate kinase